ncbi:LmbU family transcriptional regulator [Kibdelosporangium persicum]|uniref:Transcriptional regulator NovE n=1 Tax=Kibdelosporangium persicum TaxID=2698649 RepID=A0ABX2FDH4_9PSEU|nr:LmbU family transcriptional regulator [Kibdelosporangium persicum]NRN69409.1 Transcriptional regulator NovE [Kibdelosporangium persicum]
MPSNSTTPRVLGTRMPRNVQTTRTSLLLPDDMAIDTWRALGEEILAVSESSVWWLGDWLVFGERKYPDRYKRAMRQTSLDYQTLRNYAWAARRFPPARRRPKLSLQHHIEVAALPQRDQDHWLGFAERMRWGRDELRRQMRASAAPDTDAQPVATSLKLTFGADQMRRWSAAADDAGTDLTAWITSVLDDAARDVRLKPTTTMSPRRRSA